MNISAVLLKEEIFAVLYTPASELVIVYTGRKQKNETQVNRIAVNKLLEEVLKGRVSSRDNRERGKLEVF